MSEQSSKPIVLGAGELYIIKSSEITDPFALTTAEEAKLVNIGAIESGANITIKKEYEDVKSANRGVITSFVKSTDVSFKTGVITFVLKNIADFLYGAEYTSDTTTKTNKMIISEDAAPEVYLRFIHTDKKTGKTLTVNIFNCMFNGEQEFSFSDEKATIVNYEFRALPVSDTSKLCYVEFIEKEPTEE